jgi:Transposase
LLPGKEDEVEQTEEPVELVERVGALDIGKAPVTACLRVPHQDKPGRRRQEVREYATLVPALLELADWLRSQRVQLVAMQATSSSWKPAFYLLEAEGFTCWLLNAPHVKQVPGRPQDRPAGRGVAGQGHRARQVPAEPGASQADPPPARPDPLPAQPGSAPGPGRSSGWSSCLRTPRSSSPA